MISFSWYVRIIYQVLQKCLISVFLVSVPHRDIPRDFCVNTFTLVSLCTPLHVTHHDSCRPIIVSGDQEEKTVLKSDGSFVEVHVGRVLNM
jgi:hypothetical protein